MTSQQLRPIRLARKSTEMMKRPSVIDRIDGLISILATPPKERSESDVMQVVGYMKALPFFTELVGNLDNDALIQCCQVMTVEHYDSYQFVFREGSIGTAFYVILRGSVHILKTEKGNLQSELAELKAGDSFGELALISSELRAGSAVCREHTSLGKLTKTDYLRILGKSQTVKLTKKVDLLQNNPIFARWTKYSLQKFSYFFSEKVFHRKQIVFKSGSEVNEIFFIQHGDFQLSAHIQIPVYRVNGGKKKNMECQAEVTLVSSGELLGAFEALKGVKHRYDCVCYSTTGSVLAISKRDFFERMTGDDALQNIVKINEMVEGRRRTRLERISKREKEKRDVQRLLFSKSLSGLSSPVLYAKQELEAEVRHRWGSPDLELPLSMARTLAPSPSFSSPSPSPQPSPQLTWSDIMQAKFTHPRSPRFPPKQRPVNIHTHKLRPARLSYEQLISRLQLH